MTELANPDDYPEDEYDDDAWLAVPPPAELGSAIRAIVATAVGLDDTVRASVEAAFNAAYDDAMSDVEQECNEALDEHPIGESASCQEITTVEPWINAIRMRVGYGACYVARAVAARDHNLISAEDFATLTGWWVEAGLPIPAPISDTERRALVEWWTELGVRVPDQASKP